MTYEELTAWWYSVCPPNAEECNVTAFQRRHQPYNRDKQSNSYYLTIKMDGYTIEIKDDTINGVYEKAKRMINNNKEFKTKHTSPTIQEQPQENINTIEKINKIVA